MVFDKALQALKMTCGPRRQATKPTGLFRMSLACPSNECFARPIAGHGRQISNLPAIRLLDGLRQRSPCSAEDYRLTQDLPGKRASLLELHESPA